MAEPLAPARLLRETYSFQCEVQTRFADLDMLRHINNVAMGILFTEARLMFHQKLFSKTPRPEGIAFVVVQNNYRFIGETFYPGAVSIGLGISHIGRSSLTYSQALFQNGRCTSLCDTTLVGLREKQPSPFPLEMRRILQVYEMSL